MRPLGRGTVLACLAVLNLVLAVRALAATSPHAQMHRELLGCRKAATALQLVAVKPKSLAANRAWRATEVYTRKCGDAMGMRYLVSQSPNDAALQAGYRAYVTLAQGLADYQLYVIYAKENGKSYPGILHRARREVKRGLTLAKPALARLA